MLIFYNAGKGQKVVSFSFYGEMKSMYYEGIQENAESLEVKLQYSNSFRIFRRMQNPLR